MLKHLPIAVSERLLSDQSAGQNILWLTDNYQTLGDGYQPDCPLTADNVHVVQPRSRKSEEEQLLRTRSLGEVFTPVPVVRLMVDSCQAPSDWRDFVTARWLEVACGEAPFLATPYDSVTGETIPLPDRCGVLDRKLQAVSDNTDNEPDWLHWAMCALQSVYGFELQGDSLLIARRNLLSAYCEHLQARWHRDPSEDECLQAADIIAWNLWQMDGSQGIEMEHIDFLLNAMGPPITPDPPDCFLMDWTDGTKMKWGDTLKKFDFVIGNPPYQDDEKTGDQKNYSPPIYHKFWELSKEVGDVVELITPARFLFDAGSTPKEWNEKMLNDPHFKVLKYEPDASKVFPKQDIKGGIVVGLWDRNREFGAIKKFTPYPELNGILEKVTNYDHFVSLSTIAVTRTAYKLTDKMHKDHPEALGQLSKGHAYDMSSNIFTRLPQIFFDENPYDGYEYIRIIGREKNQRVYKYIRRDYVNDVKNFEYYKVFLPQAIGSGEFGEVFPPLIIGYPKVGATETFMSIGCFDSEWEAESLLKYIKTKFVRALLGVLKVTQHNTPDKWQYVPLQFFSTDSDIDWDDDIHYVDEQLYEKYGLSVEEIAFIESKVKAME